MAYYLLPPNNNILSIEPDDLNIKLCNNIDNIKSISNSLKYYLSINKTKIESVYDEWDNIKKYVNPYEFIHTNIPHLKYAVSKYLPISRSFFKFIEMCSTLKILDSYYDKPIVSFHLAEGPGGFIEGMLNLRNNINDKYYGMTLISDDINIPGWNKAEYLLERHQNISIEKGILGDGDILSHQNYKYCANKYNNSIDIITADGGFDFSINFNMQEISSTKLIMVESLYAISMQKMGGSFLLKVFDCFTQPITEIIYLLTMFYKKVYILKPNTSRYANSERYIICKDFKYECTKHFFPKFYYIIDKISKSDMFIESIFNYTIPYLYILKIEEINAVIGQQQLDNIITTINLINNRNIHDKLEQLKINNITKCINWCIKYNVNYNNINQHNIFLKRIIT